MARYTLQDRQRMSEKVLALPEDECERIARLNGREREHEGHSYLYWYYCRRHTTRRKIGRLSPEHLARKAES